MNCVSKLKIENEQMKTDLAIINEYTNLDDCNTLKTFRDAVKRIRRRTKKYENLRRCWHTNMKGRP